MRYLWVEDFNDEGNIDTEKELEERLKDFFDLQNDKVIEKRTLSSAIEFLENKDNMDQIDAILIDIRFPEGKEDIYLKYFSEIVTYKFYDENIEEASGILLYLLLIFRYHISQKKMAFVSANISNDDKLKTIQDMMEIIVKSKYVILTEEDIMSYKTLETKLGKKILNLASKSDMEWEKFIVNGEKKESVNIEKLLNDIRLLPARYPEKFIGEKNEKDYDMSSAQVKYNEVKKQFDLIGFAMPSAFEKPRIGEKKEKRYSFLQWETDLFSDIYTSVRSSIQEMCIILITVLQNNYSVNTKIYSSFMQLLTCNSREKKEYDCKFFVRYLQGIKGLFAIDCVEEMERHCERTLKEIAAVWEATAIPTYDDSFQSGFIKRHGKMAGNSSHFEHKDNCYYACHAIMKIIRNWTGHQGIRNVKIIDVGLAFLVCMRGVFDIESLPKKFLKRYCDYEERILSIYDQLYVDDGTIYDDVKDSFNYFCALNNTTFNTTFKKNNKLDIYSQISGLGHSQSTIRREVSMDEIYMLLYHILNNNQYGIFISILQKIKVRTWKDWRKRYNVRFEKYIDANGYK